MSSSLFFSTSVTILGKRIDVRTDNEDVIGCLKQDASNIQFRQNAGLQSQDGYRLKILATNGRELRDPPQITYTVESDRLAGKGEWGAFVANRKGRKSEAVLSSSILSYPEFFLRAVFDSMTYFLATDSDRTPFHAAAVTHGDTCLALTGPSNVGKSTLCYGLLKRGYTFLSEETIFVSRAEEGALWGKLSPIGLRSDTSALFPELASMPLKEQYNGKTKMTLCPIEQGFPITDVFQGKVKLVFLERKPGLNPCLRPIPQAEAVAHLAREREAGYDLHPVDDSAWLVASEPYVLKIGEFDRTVDMLEELLVYEARN